MNEKRLICWTFILLLAILLNGCTKYIAAPYPVYINQTVEVIKNQTIYANESCVYTGSLTVYNTTEPVTDTKRVLDLIQRLKRCEDRIIRNMNLSDCYDELVMMNETVQRLNKTLEGIKNITGGGK